MRLLVVIVGISIGGCGSSSQPARATIGPGGGSVRLAGASLEIPPAALAASTSIELALITPAPGSALPPSYTPVSSYYALTPAGTHLAVPAKIVLPVDSAAQAAQIETSSGGAAYKTLSTTVVDAMHVSAPFSDFGDFVAAVTSGVDMRSTGGAIDLGLSDLATPCMPADSGNQFNCTVTDTCGGHVYQMSCTTPDSGATPTCVCSKDGTVTTMFPMSTTCSSTSTRDAAYATSCLFP
jgi:hypothetical protein